MQFIHKNCSGSVVLNLSGAIKILSEPFVDAKGKLRASSINMIPQLGTVKGKDVLYRCDKCEKDFGYDELQAVCSYCFRPFDISKLVTNKESGGFLCEDCDKKHFGGKTSKALEETLKSLIIG